MDTSQSFNRELLEKCGNLSEQEHQWVSQCRRAMNRLGFCYQLIFVKFFNRFPQQNPLEIMEDVLSCASLQIGIPIDHIYEYQKRRATLSEHQNRLMILLQLNKYDTRTSKVVDRFIFDEAMRFDQPSLLLNRTQQFLKENKILQPGEIRLKRSIATQKKRASQLIFSRIESMLQPNENKCFDNLLSSSHGQPSSFQNLKLPPATPSAKSLITLGEKIHLILSAGFSNWDLSWLHPNYQRHMARYAYRCSADRIRALTPGHRKAVMVCFLTHTYQETLDQIVDTFIKLMTRVTNQINKKHKEGLHKKRKVFKESLFLFQKLGHIILDEKIPETDLKKALFKKVKKEDLKLALERCENFLVDDQESTFSSLVQRFSYLRQFSPLLLEILPLETIAPKQKNLIKAINVLRKLNDEGKRKLPNETSIDFIPKPLQKLVKIGDSIQKSSYECAVLMELKKEVKNGNVTVKGSKRFCDLDTFFMPYSDWEGYRDAFFKKAKLPHNEREQFI